MQGLSTIKQLRSRLAVDATVLHRAMLACVLLLGAALRLYDLGGESYRTDEVTMINIAGSSIPSILSVSDGGGGRPPLYVLLAHFWLAAFGTSEVATRALSALIGIAALLMMYFVGRELFGRTAGLLSTLIMSVAEFQIFQSQNFRYYSLFVFMALLSYWCCIRALRSGRRRDFAFYTAASLALFFTHSFGVFVLAAQNAYFLLQWRPLRAVRWQWIASQCVIALTIGAGLLIALSKVASGTSDPMLWIPDRPLWYPALTLLKFVFPGRHFPGLAVFLAAAAFALGGIALFAWARGGARWFAALRTAAGSAGGLLRPSPELLLAATWLLIPIGAPFVLSKLLGPLYLDRYMISAAPAFYLLLAVGVLQLSQVVPPLVAIGVLAFLIAPGLREYYTVAVSEQWRDLAAEVQQTGAPGDVVIFAPSEDGSLQRNFNWYYQGSLARCDVESGAPPDAAAVRVLHTCLAGHQRAWLVSRGASEDTGPSASFVDQMAGTGMSLASTYRYTGLTAYLFEGR